MTAFPSKDVVSAGGVVVDDRPDGTRRVLLIVHRSMSGHPRWTLPKGGLEPGESPEQAALREVREETGHGATIEGSLGSIAYSFVWRPDRIRYHKQVHYFLMRWDGLPPGERDDEAEHVEWVPYAAALLRLAHRNERELVEAAGAAASAGPAAPVGPEAPVEA
jgi:8-oxo-dGTP pyrophosphatase MutT (NUDIX family)